MSLSRVFQRVGLGLGAAVMWLPIVMIIMVSVSVGFGKDYDHPLIKRLNEDGTAQAYLLAVFCAVIAAPLVEEFLFRVLLQGWLQSIPWTFRSTWWLLGANRQQSRLVMGGAVDVPVVAQVLDTLPAETLTPEPPANPYLPTLTVTDPGTVGTADPNGEPPVVTLNEPKPPIWPVFVAGTLFGLAHYDYGLSFIPLILLGIVLGFLYRATHSIWPCFVLHFCLNSFSMAGLGISLLMEAAK